MKRLAKIASLTGSFLLGLLLAYTVLTANAAPPTDAWSAFQFTGQVWNSEPSLPIPNLSELVGAVQTDAEALASVRAYYDANAESLAILFSEPDDQRSRALFGMYLIHTAVPYNVVSWDWEHATFLEFVNAPTAHCGAYARAQSQLYTALGLEWRSILVDGGWHGLIEARIGAAYEVFDSTSNVWVSQPVAALLQGVEREYRAFWTPITDPRTSDVYRQHIIDSGGYYNVSELRAGIPLWGLAIFPSKVDVQETSS